MPLVSSSSEHAWLSQTRHSAKRAGSFAHRVEGALSTSPYYHYPMQFNRDIGYYGRPKLFLTISDREATPKETFYLCDMPLWAEHYGLSTPWPFIFTAALGIIDCNRNDDYLRLEPGLVKRALNPMGIATPWNQEDSWSTCGDIIQETLEEHFPLDGSVNRPFTILAEQSHLHFTSVFYALMALTEASQDASYYSYM